MPCSMYMSCSDGIHLDYHMCVGFASTSFSLLSMSLPQHNTIRHVQLYVSNLGSKKDTLEKVHSGEIELAESDINQEIFLSLRGAEFKLVLTISQGARAM